MAKDETLTDEQIQKNALAMVAADQEKENGYFDESEASISRAMGARSINIGFSSSKITVDGIWKRIISVDITATNPNKATHEYSAVFTKPVLAFIWMAKRLIELLNIQYKAEWQNDVPDKMEFDMKVEPAEIIETKEE